MTLVTFSYFSKFAYIDANSLLVVIIIVIINKIIKIIITAVSKALCAQWLGRSLFCTAGVPVTKEPAGLSRMDGKRLDGLTLVPWQSGKSLCWDVSVICPLAESYVNVAAREAGAAAEVAASCKDEKYAELDSRYLLLPIAVETISVFNSLANSLLKEIGLRISANTGWSREASFLYQRISVLVQRFNAIPLQDSLLTVDCADWIYSRLFSYS